MLSASSIRATRSSRNFADEFQRHVNSFRSAPIAHRRKFAGLNCVAKFAIASRTASRLDPMPQRIASRLTLCAGMFSAGIKKIPPHHIQRRLRACHLTRSRSPGKLQTAFDRSFSVCQRDVHQPDRFFRRASAGPCYAGDSHAQRAARAPADSVGQRQRNFCADRAVGFDHRGRHVNPCGLQLIAIADYSAKKIIRASGDAREPLCKQAARATFRCRNSSLVQCESVGQSLIRAIALAL